MTLHIPEKFSARLIDWSPFVIMGNMMPPRDPDEDEEDEDEDEEDRADEPPVVREPDEDKKHDAFRIGQSLSFGNSWSWRRGGDHVCATSYFRLWQYNAAMPGGYDVMWPREGDALRSAAQADTASHLDDWVNRPFLKLSDREQVLGASLRCGRKPGAGNANRSRQAIANLLLAILEPKAQAFVVTARSVAFIGDEIAGRAPASLEQGVVP
jgi:hypothetical protein